MLTLVLFRNQNDQSVPVVTTLEGPQPRLKRQSWLNLLSLLAGINITQRPESIMIIMLRTNHISYLILTMCSSRKYPLLPPQKGLEFPGGWGVLEDQKIYRNVYYEAYLDFSEGWGGVGQV